MNRKEQSDLDKLIASLDSLTPVSGLVDDEVKELESDRVRSGLQLLEAGELDTGLPEPVTLKQKSKYQFVNGLRKQTLNQLIPALPEPGTDIYLLSNGAGAERKNGSDRGVFDFGAFVPYLVDMVAPDGGAHVYISTWTMNRRAADALVKMIKQDEISQLVVCVDQYFNKREKELASYLCEAMIQCGDQHRYFTFRNHAKVICVSGPDAPTATVTGSANLSSQPRIEQYILSTSPLVYEFFVENLFMWAAKKADA